MDLDVILTSYSFRKGAGLVYLHAKLGTYYHVNLCLDGIVAKC